MLVPLATTNELEEDDENEDSSGGGEDDSRILVAVPVASSNASELERSVATVVSPTTFASR